MNKNPLNTNFNLPPFSLIQVQHIKCAIQKKLTDCYNTVDQIVSKRTVVTWDNLFYPLMIVENELKKVWSPIVHLNSVKHNVELRAAYEESLCAILEYKNWVNHHYGLYIVYKSLRNSDSYQFLSVMKKAALNKILNDFELSGICLSVNKKRRLEYIYSKLHQLSIKFSNNILDATMGWTKLVTDKKMLSGIPDSQLKIAYLEAQIRQEKGWLFTLQYASFSSILLYCDDANFREEIYWAFSTRASDEGPNKGKWDNTMIMDEILFLRYELAQILGFDSYFEKSLSVRIVKSPDQIFKFLMNLFNYIHNYSDKEFLEIQNFAQKYYSHGLLKPWDVGYYREKQKHHIFSVTDIELCDYFPEKKVLYGMFTVAQRVYGIYIKQRNNIDTWHPDVQFFDIFDSKNQWKGGFYLDLYLRNNKYEGAWMDVYVNRMNISHNEKYQHPIAYLTCNFNPPENSKKPCLLTISDVITLFHEFGHVLHHILTSIDIPIISGINGVSWDVVEVPSQIMEKFCWELDVWKLISIHYKTKQSLSDSMINNLLRLKEFNIASNLLKQVIYGLFDFKIHHEYLLNNKEPIFNIFNKMRKAMSKYPVENYDRFAHSFTHIFSNDYAAGYYSYLWSDMLASSIWTGLKKSDCINTKIKELFFNDYFNVDSSMNLLERLKDFCNHEITIKSMLDYYGIFSLS